MTTTPNQAQAAIDALRLMRTLDVDNDPLLLPVEMAAWLVDGWERLEARVAALEAAGRGFVFGPPGWGSAPHRMDCERQDSGVCDCGLLELRAALAAPATQEGA